MTLFVDTEAAVGAIRHWRRVSACGPGACSSVISVQQADHQKGQKNLDKGEGDDGQARMDGFRVFIKFSIVTSRC
jgi:hypothetical protein